MTNTRAKVLNILMVSSILLSPTITEAQKKPEFTNRIFPNNKTLKENRPIDRIHPYGGTLVWGSFHKPQMINPILTQSSISASLMELIFDSLVRVDSEGNIIPNLAERWDIPDDGLEYTFYLKKGVKFHDGVELTAEDVKFTYEQIRKPENNSPWRTSAESIDRWEIIDSYTVKMVLKEIVKPILFQLTREIVPKHIFENKDIHSGDFNYSPIGSGSFKFKSWDQKTNQIELVANKNYFDGRPYLDKVIVKAYSNAAQVWAALMRQEVDLVQWITRENYSIVDKDPAFKAYAIPFKMYYAMVYNLQDSIWQDKDLRQAIACGINTRGIIDSLPGIEGEQSVGPFHSESKGFNHAVKPFKYDPVKAKMTLMHRGWQDTDNGIRKKNGRELELRLLIDERNEMYKTMAKMIRQNLSEIGIKTTVLLYKDEKELTQDYLDKYKPQAWLRLFSGLGFGASDSIGSWNSSSSQFGQLWNYKNQEVDQLSELGKITLDDIKRENIYKDIHKIIYDDQPACFLFYPTWYLAVNTKFENTKEYFSMRMPTYTINDWYLKGRSEM